MRALLLVLLLAACGDDGAPASDARLLDSASILDGGVADAALDASNIGRFCATTAVDGSLQSCPGSVCCASGTTICTAPEDCPAGGGGQVCTASSGCGASRICCRLPDTSQICMQTRSCSGFGGTPLP